jgi:RNA polymerase sigma factor (sigma-70 family)
MNVDPAHAQALAAARRELRVRPERDLCEELASDSPARARAAALLLTEAYAPLILGICRSRLHGRPFEDVEDAANFASERYFARLLTGKTVRDPKGLAASIAHNTCSDHYRTQYRRAPEQAWDEAIGRLPASEDVVQRVDDRMRLRLVGERMTRDQREVAAGRLLGLSSAEIGARLDKTPNAVDAHRSRIRNTYGSEFET